MKLETNQLSASKVEFKISLDKTELNQYETNALKKLAPKVKTKGFRPGKAPLQVIKKELDPNLLNEQVLDDAINTTIIKAFEDQKIQPLDRPEVSLTQFVPGEKLDYTATFEIVPPIKLPDYKKLKAKLETAKVTDKEVDETLDKIQKGYAETKDSDQPAKLGDQVVIDFTGYVDDKPFQGGEAKDYTLELGSGQFIPGFEDQIVNHKAGDKFDVKVDFPKDYHAKDLKGKPAVFTTTLKQVKQLILPEIDDKLAQKTGDFKTLDDLKADIKKNLLVQKQEFNQQKYRDDLVIELAKGAKTEIPEVLKQDQIEAIKRDMNQNLAYQGLTLENYLGSIDKTEDQWLKDDVEPAAIDRVKSGLALAELSKIFEIEVTPQDVEARLGEIKQQYANSPEALKQLASPNVARDLRNNILTERTIDQLVKINQ